VNFKTVFYTCPEYIVSGYLSDYRLTRGIIEIEDWMADILLSHGYGLSLKPEKGGKKRCVLENF